MVGCISNSNTLCRLNMEIIRRQTKERGGREIMNHAAAQTFSFFTQKWKRPTHREQHCMQLLLKGRTLQHGPSSLPTPRHGKELLRLLLRQRISPWYIILNLNSQTEMRMRNFENTRRTHVLLYHFTSKVANKKSPDKCAAFLTPFHYNLCCNVDWRRHLLPPQRIHASVHFQPWPMSVCLNFQQSVSCQCSSISK